MGMLQITAATVKAPALNQTTIIDFGADSAIQLTADNATLVLGIIPRSPRVPRDVQALISLADFGVEGAAVLASLEAA